MPITLQIEDINSLLPLNQSIGYDGDHWLSWLSYDPILKEILDQIISKYPSAISRSDIISFFTNDSSELLAGFLMTMIWGHGYIDGGKADNRGPWKFKELYTKSANPEVILQSAYEYLKEDNIKGAHIACKPLKRCRVNFFSKFLYFLGRGIEMKRYPLIFDARVANSLVRLNSAEKSISQLVRIDPKQDSQSYTDYVNLIHDISEKNGIEAENLEYYLFIGKF